VIFAVSSQALGRRAAKEGAKMVPNAAANIKGFDNENIHGLIGFYEKSHEHGVLIMGELTGLEPNEIYAMHIHEIGSCESPKAPGEHFDPVKDKAAEHNHGHAAGDLPNVKAGDNGNAAVNYTAKELRTDDSNLSVIDRSIVIHKTKNGKPTEPVACGVIQHVH